MIIKLPEIPRTVQSELYNYFVQLHVNITAIQTDLAQIDKQVKYVANLLTTFDQDLNEKVSDLEEKEAILEQDEVATEETGIPKPVLITSATITGQYADARSTYDAIRASKPIPVEITATAILGQFADAKSTYDAIQAAIAPVTLRLKKEEANKENENG